MENYCRMCGSPNNLQPHHIISGKGFRKACETKESVIFLCINCHSFIHSSKGHDYWMKLKRNLQKTYFEQGKTEQEVRTLMGDKLILTEGNEIYGL